MRILISGSHGLVGTALIESLKPDGHEVFHLVRYAPRNDSEIEWSPDRYSIALARLEGFDAVVHLAGESIAEGRWTDEKKKRIRESRARGTQLLSAALANLAQPPRVLISASAIGYYGNRGDEILTEQSPPGDDFLAEVCVAWEKATALAAEKGIRTVNARFGVILDKNGGALAKMLPAFRMGVGGRIGSGKQWMSWIALDDVVGAINFILKEEFRMLPWAEGKDERLEGPVNFVAPNPVTNGEFTKTLGKVLSRPTLFPIPGFGVRLVFGEMADALLLSGQRVEPVSLTKAGYQFQYLGLEEALRHMLAHSD